MFGITFFKADPSTYVMLYKNGKLTKQGTGINFYYHDLGASLLAIPLNSQAIPFAFAMKSKDYQNLTVQGQVTYRIAHPMWPPRCSTSPSIKKANTCAMIPRKFKNAWCARFRY
ncbi:NrtR-regulated hypothetical OrfX [Photobacterium aphoticum]|uniref:NrtR-regulated hypothetical OrfX n=1 Tax=Photobacterium aphoticum TaxID=754436 RepID=A0A090R338_9GAMM|nr:NrtR-regulated hypothetical OrfX [Photobacterium aphoticum]